MIKKDKDRVPTYFKGYGLTTIEISSLVTSINLITNNYRKEYKNKHNNDKYENINTTDIFNTWIYYNPRWEKMPFSFIVDVFDYINTIKDESGIILS